MLRQFITPAAASLIGLTLVLPRLSEGQQDRREAEQERSRPQQRSGSQSAEMRQSRLQLPGSEDVLTMDAEVPEETRIGDSFQYTLRIANTSENVAIHHLTLSVQPQQGLTIENVKLRQSQKQGASSQSTSGQQSTNQQANRSSQNQQNPSQQQGQSQQSQSQQSQSQQSQSSQQSNQSTQQKASDQSQQSGQSQMRGAQEVTIQQLLPGESSTIEITATAEQEGPAQACIAVKSFSPAFCLQTKAVKPELELVKRAPETAELCDPLEFEYFVKNTGSGDLGSFEIIDELPQGLQTETGDNQLKFSVDGLKAGDVRKFVATLVATEPGEYSSRAVAKTGDDQQTRSSKTTTQVQQAQLAVAIDGPSTVMVHDPFTYRIRVTNQGNVPVENARLQLNFPQMARINSTGEVRQTDQKVERQSGSSQPTSPAESESAGVQQASGTQQGSSSESQRQSSEIRQASASTQSDSPQTASRQSQQQQMESRQWDLASLEPGETKAITVTLTATQAENLQTTAIAEYRCETQDDDWLESQAFVSTEAISVPALLLTVIDNEQQRDESGRVQYTILVRNQGTAAAKNLELKAQLPEGVEFVEGSGATQIQAEGRDLTIQPLTELGPDERARWEVRTRSTADQQQQVRFRVELTSDSLERSVSAEEPTTLLPQSSRSAQDRQSRSNE